MNLFQRLIASISKIQKDYLAQIGRCLIFATIDALRKLVSVAGCSTLRTWVTAINHTYHNCMYSFTFNRTNLNHRKKFPPYLHKNLFEIFAIL